MGMAEGGASSIGFIYHGVDARLRERERAAEGALLDQVGGGALDNRVDGLTLGLAAFGCVGGGDAGQLAHAPSQAPDIPMLASMRLAVLQEGLQPREGVDEALAQRACLRDAQMHALRKALDSEPICVHPESSSGDTGEATSHSDHEARAPSPKCESSGVHTENAIADLLGLPTLDACHGVGRLLVPRAGE